ncbi:RDD family protein [Solimonas marina]|uniref:RDD family protein n=1 Tax=Solimonas marina TaxID=2714601 RepID=A0A970B599_9GAMM|nr:RDD family protein [Solimonas marina]NKF23182.1 RDD family protein [Solimonas marina]
MSDHQKNAFVTHTLDRTRSLEGVPLASFRRRTIAWSIDFLLLATVSGAAWIQSITALFNEHGDAAAQAESGFSPFHSFGSLLLVVLYFGLATYWGHGKTLGKKLMGIRVISLVGERLTLWQCIERGLGYGASALEAGFGFWQYFIHHNRQTVHDRIAETIVVRDTALDPRTLHPRQRAALQASGVQLEPDEPPSPAVIAATQDADTI